MSLCTNVKLALFFNKRRHIRGKNTKIFYTKAIPTNFIALFFPLYFHMVLEIRILS